MSKKNLLDDLAYNKTMSKRLGRMKSVSQYQSIPAKQLEQLNYLKNHEQLKDLTKPQSHF